MKVTKGSIILFFYIIIMILIIFPSNGLGKITALEFLMFFSIGFIAIIQILIDYKKNSYSLNIMHGLFVLFFFVLAPMIQVDNDFIPWKIIELPEKKVIINGLLILLWMSMYILGNYIGKRIILVKQNKPLIREKKYQITRDSMIVLTILTIVISVFLVCNIGLNNIFSRATAGFKYEGTNAKMIGLLFNNVPKALIAFSVAVSLISYRRDKKYLSFLIINIICLLITNFPTALPRNAAGTIYLGLFIIFFYNNIEKFKKIPIYIIVFAIVFIIMFPAINVFRRFSFNDADFVGYLNLVLNDITSNYLSEDYDAFSIITATYDYVNIHGITYFKQFFGAILFFVPRAIWAGKPIGSGQMIFESLNQSYTNISCPLVAEGYINFGILGVMIFAIFTGIITICIDNEYWRNVNKNNNNLLYILYPFILPSFFFVLRGDLMATFPYMMVYIVVFYVLHTVFIKNGIKIGRG